MKKTFGLTKVQRQALDGMIRRARKAGALKGLAGRFARAWKRRARA